MGQSEHPVHCESHYAILKKENVVTNISENICITFKVARNDLIDG